MKIGLAERILDDCLDETAATFAFVAAQKEKIDVDKRDHVALVQPRIDGVQQISAQGTVKVNATCALSYRCG